MKVGKIEKQGQIKIGRILGKIWRIIFWGIKFRGFGGSNFSVGKKLLAGKKLLTDPTPSCRIGLAHQNFQTKFSENHLKKEQNFTFFLHHLTYASLLSKLR